MKQDITAFAVPDASALPAWWDSNTYDLGRMHQILILYQTEALLKRTNKVEDFIKPNVIFTLGNTKHYAFIKHLYKQDLPIKPIFINSPK